MENPRIAVVSMVKNECDIIEFFIRHNAPFCKRFYILDHHSTDSTLEVIHKLIREGFDVEIKALDNLGYKQNKFTTQMVREIASKAEFDYIIPLDADEFLPYDKDLSLVDEIHKKIEIYQVGYYFWKNFVPIKDSYMDSLNPLINHFRARSTEPVKYKKIILGNTYALSCDLEMGNHGCLNVRRKTIKIDAPLQHFPVRSIDQILRKALFGVYAYELRNDRIEKGLGFQWHDILARFRENNYTIDFEELLDIGMKYAVPKDHRYKRLNISEEKPKLDQSITIKYPDLMHINLLSDADKFIMKLVTSMCNN